MSKGNIHILNGEAMYDFFKERNFLQDEVLVPFNEAMCCGEVTLDLFSAEFVATRANVHHVSVDDYKEKTIKPLLPLIQQDFSRVALWFDEDMFCQINLLTVLAWLEQVHDQNPIDLHIVGENFAVLRTYQLTTKGYASLYEQVLIRKEMPSNIVLPELEKGIELYLQYLKEDSELIQFIDQHQNVPEQELMVKMLREFGEYGLGDVQYLELITNRRAGSGFYPKDRV